MHLSMVKITQIAPSCLQASMQELANCLARCSAGLRRASENTLPAEVRWPRTSLIAAMWTCMKCCVVFAGMARAGCELSGSHQPGAMRCPAG